MIKLPNTVIDLDGNTFKAQFKLSFVPPSKQEYKDKYRPFNGQLQVEKDRLLKMYEILTETLEGKLLEDTFILNADTANKAVVALIPPKYLSEKARQLGGIYGMKFQTGNPLTDEIVYSGRAILSLSYINSLRNLIKTKGHFGYAFGDKDENGNLHTVIIERNNGKIVVTYPVYVELSDTKKSKLQKTVKSFLSGLEKVPTTIVVDKVVFRKATSTGKFAIHTPHHTIVLSNEDVKKLNLLVED